MIMAMKYGVIVPQMGTMMKDIKDPAEAFARDDPCRANRRGVRL